MSLSLRDWDKRLEVRERPSWLFGSGRLNRGQPLPHAVGERDDPLTLVAVEGFLVGGDSFVGSAGGFKDPRGPIGSLFVLLTGAVGFVQSVRGGSRAGALMSAVPLVVVLILILVRISLSS